MGDDKRAVRKFQCTECNRATSHEILHTEEAGGFDEGSGMHWGSAYHTVKCRGCDTISFAEVSWNSEDMDDEGQPIAQTNLYPSRAVRKPIEDYFYLPGKVFVVYKETLAALSNKAPILAAIGIRAVVEAICADKGSVARNLEGKIDLLVQNGHLSSSQAGFLHLQRFMGNAAAHEIAAPDRTELEAALDIAENLLKTLYVLPMLAQDMRKSQTKLEARNTRLGLPGTPVGDDE
jgi:Domain of unknown function (DUF4145)